MIGTVNALVLKVKANVRCKRAAIAGMWGHDMTRVEIGIKSASASASAGCALREAWFR